MRSIRWLFPALPVLLLSLPAGTARASQYIGERCWNFVDPANPADPLVGTFALTNEGDGHISLRGQLVGYRNGVPEADLLLANGNAEQISGTLVLMLNISASETPTGGDFTFTVLQVRLDPMTLNGTFRGVVLGIDDPSGSPIGPDLEEGPVEFLPGCVVP